MNKTLLPWCAMVYMGCMWGLSFSLGKLATDYGGAPLGISFWSAFFSGGLLGLYCMFTGRRFVLNWALIKILCILGLLGSALPGLLFYYAASRVPAGVLSITVTLVPIFTYALALLVRVEQFAKLRFFGLILGLASICVIALPETSLPSKSAAIWALLACLSSFFYALENIYLGIAKLDGIGPLRLSCGMGFTSAAFLLIPAFFTGTLTETLSTSTELTLTIFGLSLIGATAYTCFVYVVRVSGPIFASQVGYLVTVCGIVWGIVIFGEVHSAWIWMAFVLMMLGLLCVSPRKSSSNDQKTSFKKHKPS